MFNAIEKSQQELLAAMSRQLPFKASACELQTDRAVVKTQQGPVTITGRLLDRIKEDLAGDCFLSMDMIHGCWGLSLEGWIDLVGTRELEEDVMIFFDEKMQPNIPWPHVATPDGPLPLSREKVVKCLVAAAARLGLHLFLEDIKTAPSEHDLTFLESPMKAWWKSRTVWLNLATTAVAVGGVLAGQEWIAENPQVVAVIGMIVGGANILLRFLTTEPVSG